MNSEELQRQIRAQRILFVCSMIMSVCSAFLAIMVLTGNV